MNTNVATGVSDVGFLASCQALEDGLRLGGVGIWRWKIDSVELQWSTTVEGVHQLPPGSFDGNLSSFQRDIHPDDAVEVWEKIKATVETGAPYKVVYRTIPRADFPELWIGSSGGVVSGPNGEKFLTGVCWDATEQILEEQNFKRRLKQQRAISTFGSFALHEENLQNVLEAAVLVAAEILEVPLTKILQFADGADHLILRAGVGWADGLVGHGTVGIEMASQAGFTLTANEPVIVADLLTEKRFSGPALLHDHQVRSGMSVTISGLTERPFGVFGIHTRDLRNFDDADSQFLQSLANIVAGAARQANAADHRLLLVREMAHRSGNMLQLVSSMANQTFHSGAEIEQAKKTFGERLSALGRANYVIASKGWTTTPFAEVVSEALKPFGERVETKGRDILLSPELSFDLGLVMHELATNSVKYGVLGMHEGTIKLTWIVHDVLSGARIFKLDWEEPNSSQHGRPQRSGFGTKLLTGLIQRKWNGSVTYGNVSHFSVTLEIPVGL